MGDDAPQGATQRDPDLERWARELGVTYEELRSTLNYAGPTFKDAAVSRAETPVSPTGTAGP